MRKNIDPPYNTGNDFIYNDNFTDPLEAYLQYTGVKGEGGELLTTNTRADGRFHSKWLNMMYPRLVVAHQLLREDGVIFLSIDDNEAHNLHQLLNEVFGEENFIAQMIHKNNSMKNQSKYMGVSTEYVLIYSKNIDELKQSQSEWRTKKKGASDIHNLFLKLRNQGLSLEEIRSEISELYSRPKYTHLSRWNKVDEFGVFEDSDLSREGGPKDYTIINQNTGKSCVIPNRGWGKSYPELLRLQNENLIWYGDDDTPPRMKTYLNHESESVPDNFFFADTAPDKKLIDDIFGTGVFEFPKSLDLMIFLIELCTEKDSIILDFFAGSATTAHATFQLNRNDGLQRKFIMVQLPELCEPESKAYKAGYKTVTEIGKERIRRVIKNIDFENKEKINKAPLLQNEILPIDLGFKVFKYDKSNFKHWKPLEEESAKSLVPLFENYINPLNPGWKKEELITEILLLEGFPLTSKLIFQETLLQNEVYKLSAPEFCAHDLFVCLDESIQPSTVELLTMEKEDIFVCLDSALSDELKARLQDQFNVHVI